MSSYFDTIVIGILLNVPVFFILLFYIAFVYCYVDATVLGRVYGQSRTTFMIFGLVATDLCFIVYVFAAEVVVSCGIVAVGHPGLPDGVFCVGICWWKSARDHGCYLSGAWRGFLLAAQHDWCWLGLSLRFHLISGQIVNY